MAYDPSVLSGIADRGANNPALQLVGLRQQRLEELRRALGMAKQTGTMLGAGPGEVDTLEQDMGMDPDTGVLAQRENIYNQPGEVERRNTARQDALDKLLLPIQARGQYDVAQERTRGDALVRAAEAQWGGRRDVADANQDAISARTSATNQSRAALASQTSRNKMLDTQATQAQKTGRAAYNPMHWLFGMPTGQEQADQLRGQMSFDTGDTGASSPQSLAQMAFSERQNASPQEIQQALAGMGVSDPAQVQAVIAAYNQLAGR